MHAVHKMRPIATDVTCSIVCVSSSWTHWCSVQKRLKMPVAGWFMWGCGAKKPCI